MPHLRTLRPELGQHQRRRQVEPGLGLRGGTKHALAAPEQHTKGVPRLRLTGFRGDNTAMREHGSQ
jgi:hypothetical protein